jgi:hypothetical protein
MLKISIVLTVFLPLFEINVLIQNYPRFKIFIYFITAIKVGEKSKLL